MMIVIEQVPWPLWAGLSLAGLLAGWALGYRIRGMTAAFGVGALVGAVAVVTLASLR